MASEKDGPTRRPPLDRSAQERAEGDLLPRLLADPATRVLELREGDAPVDRAGDAVRLSLRAPEAQDRDRLALFLGRDEVGVATLAVVAAPEPAGRAAVRPPGSGGRPDPEPEWLGLRDVGPQLDERDVDAYMTAVALSNWHRRNPRCPRCGAETEAILAGWVRRCVAEGSEHYPRTDAAVIMAVVDRDDRLLLAENAAWPEGRRSVLAGFVEPGERLEAAVAREVAEEVGVEVAEVHYVDSQPWPFPASLMLGFVAIAGSTSLRTDTVEIARAEWYTRAELTAALEADRIILPGSLSIARRLIERWYGGPLEAGSDVAFHRTEESPTPPAPR